MTNNSADIGQDIFVAGVARTHNSGLAKGG